MRYTNGQYSFFASDVSIYLSCRHATQLHKQYAVEGKQVPRPHDPVLDVLIQRGADHERAYVEYLQQRGLTCTHTEKKSFEETIEAMAQGLEVIVQGRLEHNEWGGYPDILIRKPGKSRFGNWQYEVQDTKLSLNTRTSAIIQLCFYTELLSIAQGEEPKQFSIVMPGNPFKIEDYAFNNFKAYYNIIKRNFKASVESDLTTYPDPVEHCHICNWWQMCNERRRKDDHLSFVAGLRKTQIQELKNQEIETLEKFALAETVGRPKRGSFENLLRKKTQAYIQYDGRIKNILLHEPILPIEEKRGFNRLPTPVPGDVYLDLEGDAFFPGGSFEYLFGVVTLDEDKNFKYDGFWATTRRSEEHTSEL